MAKWYIKEFSKLSHISERTLRHYDEIDLLKPSIRLPNGYRLYSETDLVQLQHILALKFFGFELSSIQSLLAKAKNLAENLQTQKIALKSQIDRLQKADRTLDLLIISAEKNEIIPWDHIVQIIEEYRMATDTTMIWGTNETKQKEHQKFLIDSGIATLDQIEQCKTRANHFSLEKVEQIKKEQDAIFNAFAEAIEKGLQPTTAVVQNLVRRHFEHIKNFWTPTKDSYIALGKYYLQNYETKDALNPYHPKLSEFMAEAIEIFAKRELS